MTGIPPDDRRQTEFVLREYSLPCDRVTSLGSAGGFSGATLWRIGSVAGPRCLRRWPREHPTLERLTQIHRVLAAAADRGVSFLPVPLPSRRGSTIVRHQGHFWELAPWLPGTAETATTRDPTRIRAAFRALAQFHLACRDLPDEPLTVGAVPGLEERRRLLEELSAPGALQGLIESVDAAGWSALAARARRFRTAFTPASRALASPLRRSSERRVALQPCLRDARRDHFLFVGSEVTGLVDFGAVRHDYFGGDVARLLGSLVGDDPQGRRTALQAYRELSSLNAEDEELVELFDRCNVVLSVANWLRWIGQEGRRFERPECVLGIVDEWLGRLESLQNAGR